MTRSSAEIEAEVEASRHDLDRNVEALKQKMTPGQLFDEAARVMGGTGQQVAAKFADQAKANPMPLAVMGLGLAWLMVSNNKSQSGGYEANSRAYEPRSFAGEGVGHDSDPEGSSGGGLKEKVSAVGEKAQDALSAATDKLAGARASAAERGRSAVEGLSSTAQSVRGKAVEGAHRVQRTFLDTLESEPLLIAGLGLVVGAAIGAALPRTDAEDRVLGETRDRIVEKGKDLAQSSLEKASSAAQATYGAVKSELQNGDADQEPADRLAEAARSGVQAAQDQLRGHAH